jgi:hypothetical protein
MQGTERAEARLSEAIAKARVAATQRARTEWVPTWKATAQHLRDASGAFMLLWTRYQGCVIRDIPEHGSQPFPVCVPRKFRLYCDRVSPVPVSLAVRPYVPRADDRCVGAIRVSESEGGECARPFRPVRSRRLISVHFVFHQPWPSRWCRDFVY